MSGPILDSVWNTKVNRQIRTSDLKELTNQRQIEITLIFIWAKIDVYCIVGWRDCPLYQTLGLKLHLCLFLLSFVETSPSVFS